MGTKSPERTVSDCSYTCTTIGDAAGLETSSRRLKGEVCGLSLLNQRTDSAAYVVRYVILDTLFRFIHVWGERRRVNGLRYLLQTRQPPSFRQFTSLTPTYKQTSAPWQKLGILPIWAKILGAAARSSNSAVHKCQSVPSMQRMQNRRQARSLRSCMGAMSVAECPQSIHHRCRLSC